MPERPWRKGDVIGGRYELAEEIGVGGFGEVWRATDLKRGGSVAIKALVRRRDVSDEEFEDERKRFLTEAEETSKLIDGPHIISILDWDEHDARPYIVMTYHDGLNLRALLRTHGPLDPRRSVRIVGQIADALEYAHDSERVHRDVKPSNVLVRTVGTGDPPKDHVTLVDFGIIGVMGSATWTRMTHTGALLGSCAYMAPERIPFGLLPEPRPLPDQRYDIYALACVLFECLTGRLAFDEPGLDVLGQQRWGPRPVPSEVSPSLGAFDEVVRRGLAVKPADRTPDASTFKGEMTAALDAWADGQSVVVPEPTAQPGSTTRRRPFGGLRPKRSGPPAPTGSPEGAEVPAPQAPSTPVPPPVPPPQPAQPQVPQPQVPQPQGASARVSEPQGASARVSEAHGASPSPASELQEASRPAPAVAPIPAARQPVEDPPLPPSAPVAPPVPAETSRPARWESVLSGGAVTGIAGGVASLVAQPGLPASIGIVAGTWVAGAVGWGAWRTRQSRTGSSDRGPGVSSPGG